MLLSTIVLTSTLIAGPAERPVDRAAIAPKVLAIELHSMTEEEKQAFPGRERFDKTEWYESCFKSVRTVITPEHVDEWKNGGRDLA